MSRISKEEENCVLFDIVPIPNHFHPARKSKGGTTWWCCKKDCLPFVWREIERKLQFIPEGGHSHQSKPLKSESKTIRVKVSVELARFSLWTHLFIRNRGLCFCNSEGPRTPLQSFRRSLRDRKKRQIVISSASGTSRFLLHPIFSTKLGLKGFSHLTKIHSRSPLLQKKEIYQDILFMAQSNVLFMVKIYCFVYRLTFCRDTET